MKDSKSLLLLLVVCLGMAECRHQLRPAKLSRMLRDNDPDLPTTVIPTESTETTSSTPSSTITPSRAPSSTTPSTTPSRAPSSTAPSTTPSRAPSSTPPSSTTLSTTPSRAPSSTPPSSTTVSTTPSRAPSSTPSSSITPSRAPSSTPPSSTTTTRPTTPQDACEEGQRENVCLDCRTVQQCAPIGGSWRPTTVIECEDPTPYCASGKCIDTGYCPPTIPQPSFDFNCVGGGDGRGEYFPDPTNCSRYHFCADTTAYDFQCLSSSMVFDHSKTTCVPETKSNCFTFTCTESNVGEFIAYAPDPQVYGVCSQEGVVLTKCEDNMIIDVEKRECVRYCASADNFPDETDPTQYYSCQYIANNELSKPILSKCPSTAVFDTSLRRCA